VSAGAGWGNAVWNKRRRCW